MAFTNVQEH